MAKSVYHLQKKKEFASKELEKIKEELGEYSRYTAGNDLVVDWENIEEVFKDRISELKGEQE